MGVKKMAAYRRSLLLVLLRNVSENEEDSCSLGLVEGTYISSNHSSPVEFGENYEIKEYSKLLGEDEKEAGILRSTKDQF